MARKGTCYYSSAFEAPTACTTPQTSAAGEYVDEWTTVWVCHGGEYFASQVILNHLARDLRFCPPAAALSFPVAYHTFLRLEPILAEDGVLTGVTGRNRLGVLFPAEVAGEMLILRYGGSMSRQAIGQGQGGQWFPGLRRPAVSKPPTTTATASVAQWGWPMAAENQNNTVHAPSIPPGGFRDERRG